MKLGAEILKRLGGEDPSHITYTVTDGGGGYFCNVRRVAELSPARIVVRGKKGGLAVEGEGLALGRYDEGDLEVRGSIFLVKREG